MALRWVWPNNRKKSLKKIAALSISFDFFYHKSFKSYYLINNYNFWIYHLKVIITRI